VLDRKWREHLYEMDYLQEGIGLRAMAQKDPLVEYQREGFDMFNAMMEGIKEESVGYLFNLEVQVEQQVEEVPVPEGATSLEKQDAPVAAAAGRPEIRAKGLDAPQRPDRLHFSAPTVDGEGGVVEGDFSNGDGDGASSEGDGMTRAERRKAQKSASGRRRKK
jgi:preprotein translocase subunit SecA